MSSKVVLAQIGCGYWGPNLLRNFAAQPFGEMKWLVEQSEERQNWVRENHPNVQITADVQTVLADEDVAAVIIATPAASHYELTRQALMAGKHAFVEKPLALTTEEASELIALAKRQSRTLMVGHTFLYNSCVRYLKNFMDQGGLGNTYYMCSQRLNLGKVRSDVNAWWNLAPHDISILLYLMGDVAPESVHASGRDFIQPGIEDVVFAYLKWPSGSAAHVHVSWLEPEKVRKLTVVGDKKMVVYNDVINDKIKIFDKGVDMIPEGGRMHFDQPTGFQYHHRSGGVELPHIQFTEPLAAEAAHFLDCVRDGQTPLSGPEHALKVVAILEAGQRSLKEGREIHLNDAALKAA